jgi:hypothetical protein
MTKGTKRKLPRSSPLSSPPRSLNSMQFNSNHLPLSNDRQNNIFVNPLPSFNSPNAFNSNNPLRSKSGIFVNPNPNPFNSPNVFNSNNPPRSKSNKSKKRKRKGKRTKR